MYEDICLKRKAIRTINRAIIITAIIEIKLAITQPHLKVNFPKYGAWNLS